MYKAEFDVEAITPIFMRGANPRGAEIRASSIKGLMRWWFRALAGNYFGDDIENLRLAEGRILGSAGSGGTGKSRIIIEAERVEGKSTYETKNKYEPYFWFSQVGRNSKIGRNSKPAILPGERFHITIKSYEGTALKASLLSLWMALHLGGFGSRSRKFAGSLFPVAEPDMDVEVGIRFVPPLEISIDNLKEYYSETFNALIRETTEIMGKLDFKRGVVKDIRYPIFSQETSWVFIGTPANGLSDAIEEVGKWYLGDLDRRGKFNGGFRFRHADRKIAHRIYRKYLNGETHIRNIPANDERRPYVGLPIQFYKKFDSEFVKFTVDHWNANRRASSLIMTVNKVDNKCYPVITVFKYLFMPDYRGPVKYSGGVYRGKTRVASANGKLFILRKGEDSKIAYDRFYDKLIEDLRSSFVEVFP